MTKEEIKVLTLDGVLERLNAIKTEAEAEGADIAALSQEVDELTLRKAEIENEVEARKSLMQKVAEGRIGNVIEEGHKEEKNMSRTLAEVRSSVEYANAYANYIKTNNDAECRAVLSELATDGSVPVPTILENAIENAWEKAEIANKARTMNVPGVVRIPYEKSTTDAAVHTEGGDAVDEGSIVIDTIKITPETLLKWLTVSNETLALNGVDFLNYISAEVSQRIAELADATMIDTIKASDFTQTLEGTPSWSSLLAALALLGSAASDPVIICTKNDYFTGFMSETDSTGRPIYNIISENGKPSYYVNGIQTLFTDELEDGEYIVGDMNGATVNLPDGKRVSYVSDPYTYAEKNLTKIVGKMLVGMGITKMKHFVDVSGSTATE